MSTELEDERARRLAAEKDAQAALNQLSTERRNREDAQAAASEATARLAAEQSARQNAEKDLRHFQNALKEAEAQLAAAQAKQASIEAERDAAVQSARNFAQAAENAVISRDLIKQATSELSRVEHSGSEQSSSSKTLAQLARAPSGKSGTTSGSSGSSGASAPFTPPASTATASPTAASAPAQPAAPAPKTGNNWIPVFLFAMAGLLFYLISGSWTMWQNKTAIKTDDAYVRADIAPLSTKVAGIVNRTAVTDFESVKAGQTLVILKNDEYKAHLDQSQASLRQSQIKVSDMKERKEQQAARVSQAQTALDNSLAVVRESENGINEARAAVDEAQANIEGSAATLLQSQAAVDAATSDLTRVAIDKERQENLFANESTTHAKVEQVTNEHARAVANLVAQKAALTRTRAEMAARRAELSKAKQHLLNAYTERDKAKLSVQSHRDDLIVQQKQLALLDGEEQSLASDVVSKKAAIVASRAEYDYTVIQAPQDGIVGELKVKPGQLVAAGTQVISLISSSPWIIANYRETQLGNVKVGDKASISIDALGQKQFHGHVESIAPASGAQFSLLPADNASGNFTKITQRIPVKIVFDETAETLAQIKPGMSVEATIAPGGPH
jgi:membrane fusion protein (multidrug efflux system)